MRLQGIQFLQNSQTTISLGQHNINYLLADNKSIEKELSTCALPVKPNEIQNANHITGEQIFIVVILINHLGAFFLCAQVFSVSLSRACLYRRTIINGNK